MISTEDSEGSEVLVGIDFGTTTTSIAWAIEPEHESTLSPELIRYVHPP